MVRSPVPGSSSQTNDEALVVNVIAPGLSVLKTAGTTAFGTYAWVAYDRLTSATFETWKRFEVALVRVVPVQSAEYLKV
jgi:hypothetical protein